jgi:hypothetical protein
MLAHLPGGCAILFRCEGHTLEVPMFLGRRLTLATLGSLLVIAYACNIQPSDRPAPPPPGDEPKAKLQPERGAATAEKRPAEPPKFGVKQGAKDAAPAGPLATAPSPLPKADKVIALFHSGNVEGELDPCG